MIYIQASNVTEQQKLESDFQKQNNYYIIPIQSSHKISQIIRSLTYQYFSNKCPLLIVKLQEYIIKNLNQVHSLDIYRDILSIIKKQEEKYQLYFQYIQQIDKIIESNEQQGEKSVSKISLDNVSDFIHHSNQKVEHFDMFLAFDHSEYGNSMDFQSLKKQNILELTNNSLKDTSVPLNKNISLQLERIGKLQSLLSTESNVYSRQQWKTQHKDDSSEQLKSFTKKFQSIIQLNTDFQSLMTSEMIYDMKRQAFINSHKMIKPNLIESYHKKIKNCILNSRIRTKKK